MMSLVEDILWFYLYYLLYVQAQLLFLVANQLDPVVLQKYYQNCMYVMELESCNLAREN